MSKPQYCACGHWLLVHEKGIGPCTMVIITRARGEYKERTCVCRNARPVERKPKYAVPAMDAVRGKGQNK